MESMRSSGKQAFILSNLKAGKKILSSGVIVFELEFK